MEEINNFFVKNKFESLKINKNQPSINIALMT